MTQIPPEEYEHYIGYQRKRIVALETALREILMTADPYGVECIAREVLDPGWLRGKKDDDQQDNSNR